MMPSIAVLAAVRVYPVSLQELSDGQKWLRGMMALRTLDPQRCALHPEIPDQSPETASLNPSRELRPGL